MKNSKNFFTTKFMETFKNHKYHVGLQIGASLVVLLVLVLVVAGLMRATGQIDGQCVAPPSDLVSWWPGDGNANDIIDANQGTLQNGATFAVGKVGQAFSFDGVDDVVSIPGSSVFDFGTNPFSIDFWLK